MDRVAFDEVEPTTFDGVTRQGLAEAMDATNLAINRYRIPPDAGLPGGLHAHMDQEEIFIVTGGTVTFETLDGTVSVTEGEAIRFGPGEFQSGENRGTTDAVVLALGAPEGSEDVRIPVECPACGHADLRLDLDAEGLTLACPGCEAAHLPAPCPSCSGEDLRVTLDDAHEPVVRCTACGSTFDRPPLRG